MTGPTAPGYDAIVVGGGHNGLVAGAYLARAGLRTLILEQRPEVGGQAVTDELRPGVRVPTLAHTVGRLRPDVAATLGLAEHGLALVQSEARAFLPLPDGRALTLWADARRSAGEIRRFSARDSAAWPAFDRQVRALGGYLGRLAATTPPDIGGPSAADALAGLRLGLGYRGLGREDARALFRWLPMGVADLLAEWFESEPLRALLAWSGVALTAMGPRAAGTAAVFLNERAGTDAGAAGQAVVARGGPGALSSALAGAARAFGAGIRTGAAVVAITHRDDAVSGVVLASGEEIAAPIVAAGLDPRRTLLELLDPTVLGPTLRWRAGNIRQPGRTAKVNLVLDDLPAFVGAEAGQAAAADRRLRGRIIVAPTIDDLERAADAGRDGRLPDGPALALEATIPTLVDASLAPVGTHVLSAIVHGVPLRLRDAAWDAAARDRLGDAVVAALEQVAPGITARVSVRQVIAPPDLEADYGLGGGHPLHAEPGLDQWFAWRPLLGLARYRLPLRGLYLVGSGAHPGGGITGAPGANAAREILADRRRRGTRAA
ncbi:MAG: phytoene desaturase family protein [Candidatus Limnocylindrales bacterium]